jgi:hypothetical protein
MQSSRDRATWHPPGHVIEHPQAFRLVCLGCAEPADEDCARAVAARMSPAELQAAVPAYDRAAQGVLLVDEEDLDDVDYEEILPGEEYGLA